MNIIHVDFKRKSVLEMPTSNPISLNSTSVDSSSNWYGEIKERIEARFGNKLPKHFKLAISKPQLQPYMHGDVHSALYGNKKPRNFNSPMPVPCEVTIDSCARIDGVLTLGSKCEQGIDDAFQWMDTKYQCTLNFLKSLPDGTELNILTRSDLVATSDYIVELKRLKTIVKILYTSTNEDFNRNNEPGAPSFKRREQAYKTLKKCGIDVALFKHKIVKSKQTA